MTIRIELLSARAAALDAAELGAQAADTIVVAGGTSGAGATTVAALVAQACSTEGRTVVLVEGAGETGALRNVTGLVAIDDTPADLAAPDIFVVDAGFRLEQVVAAAALGPARFIVVAAAGIVERASAYAMVKALDMRLPGVSIDLVMNGQDPRPAQDAFQQMQDAALRFLGRELRLAGSIPDDPRIRADALAGRPLAQAGTRSRGGQAAHVIAARLLTELEPAQHRPVVFAARRPAAHGADHPHGAQLPMPERRP